MTYLLFPGRHLVNTAFQARYLRSLIQMPIAQLDFLGSAPPAGSLPPINHLIFAITSSNQQHSRYNPIPFHVRAIGVDRFARPLEMTFGSRYRIFGIPHFRPTPRFAEFVLKEIEEQSEGNLLLTPENCVVACCTPAVSSLYRKLGFYVLPAEAGVTPKPLTPNDLIKQVADVGEAWQTNRLLREALATATFDLWQDFPDIPRRIIRLWRDPLLNDAGSLTENRDYSSYAFGMGNRDIIELKYQDIRDAIAPGKIVDEGCADGAMLIPIARDFPDSDLIGIEITGEFMARCLERQRAGEFGGSYAHFHQRNITHEIFEAGSVDTTICNSTVHELWSYGEQAKTVNDYLRKKFAQTARGGRLIVRDVVGPAGKWDEVYLWLNQSDGSNEDPHKTCQSVAALTKHLSGLSTFSRFLRFSRDFLAELRAKGKRDAETKVSYRLEVIDGEQYAVLSKHDAVEFMSKKDYVDNWDSEMNEEFAFWSFDEWKKAMAHAGFSVIETPQNPKQGSRIYTNPWLVENRFRGKVALFAKGADGQLHELTYPPTNIVLVGERSVTLD